MEKVKQSINKFSNKLFLLAFYFTGVSGLSDNEN